uniref:Uncharacterized protein n=1 Tax=Arundo donax TaxID=35708 RepID=A0A0A9KCY2_ARUDO
MTSERQSIRQLCTKPNS